MWEVAFFSLVEKTLITTGNAAGATGESINDHAEIEAIERYLYQCAKE